MYFPWKHLLNLSEYRFYVFTEDLFVIFNQRLATSSGIAFARNLQSDLLTFRQVLFPFVISIGSIGKQLGGLQIGQRQVSQPAQVVITARHDTKLGRDTIRRCDDLHFDAVKIPAFALNATAIRFIRDNPAPINANVVADRNGKRVEQVARFPVQIFDDQTEPMENQIEQIGQPVQAAREAGTRQHSVHQTEFFENEPGFLKVAAEVKHSNQQPLSELRHRKKRRADLRGG